MVPGPHQVTGHDDHDPVVVDGTAHVVYGRGAKVSLAKRPVLRRLLYRLASTPGIAVSREELLYLLLRSERNLAGHDGHLRVTLHRLRALTSRVGIDIESSADGHRLVVPPQFVFVAPEYA